MPGKPNAPTPGLAPLDGIVIAARDDMESQTPNLGIAEVLIRR